MLGLFSAPGDWLLDRLFSAPAAVASSLPDMASKVGTIASSVAATLPEWGDVVNTSTIAGNFSVPFPSFQVDGLVDMVTAIPYGRETLAAGVCVAGVSMTAYLLMNRRQPEEVVAPVQRAYTPFSQLLADQRGNLRHVTSREKYYREGIIPNRAPTGGVPVF